MAGSVDPETTVVTTHTGRSIIVREFPWWRMLLVRVARTYVQTLSGLTVAFLVIPTQPIIPGASAYILGPFINAFVIAAQYALLPSMAALLHNLYEYLTKLDQTAPEWRA
jgi:hypothetical protein